MNKQMSYSEMVAGIYGFFDKANAALRAYGIPVFNIDTAITDFDRYQNWHDTALAIYDDNVAKLQAQLSEPNTNMFEVGIKLQETNGILNVIEFITKSYFMIMKVIAGGVEQQTLH